MRYGETPAGGARRMARAAKERAATPKPESSVTEHCFGVGGKSFDYTATAGTSIIRDDEDKPIASIGYVTYVRHDLKSGGARPLVFAFNGGPGSSSLWLHMGVLDKSDPGEPHPRYQ